MTVGPPKPRISYVYRVMRGDGRDLQEPTERETMTKVRQDLRISASLQTVVSLPALAPDSLLRFRQEVVYAITFGSQPDYVSPFLHATKCMQPAAMFHGARCVVKPCRLPR